MFIGSEVLRYCLSLAAIVAGAFRLMDWFGPALGHAATSYSLDLCAFTHQLVCF